MCQGQYLDPDEERVGPTEQHDKELHDLYFSPNITTVIKLRGIRWVGHVKRVGKAGFWW
jgi:hypothetical protein